MSAPAMAAVDPTTEPSPPCSVSLLVLLPDLLRQHIWDELWRRLAPLALEIVATTVACLHPEDVVRLYEATRQRRDRDGRLDGLWLGQQLFALDMCVPIVVRTPVPAVDLTAIIQRWKGPSRYGRRRPGDLRAVSPLSSRCLSLFHSPDDAEQLDKDLSLLFVGGVAHQAIGQPAARTTGAADVRDLRCYVAPGDDPHPYDIVLRTLIRSLALLAHDCHLVPSPAVQAAQDLAREARSTLASAHGAELQTGLHDQLAAVGEVLAQGPSPRLVAMDGDDTELASADRQLHDRLDLANVARLLTRPLSYVPKLARLTVEALTRNGLALDDWETHRLLAAISLFSDDTEARPQQAQTLPDRRRRS